MHDPATLLKEERHALLLQILNREGKLLASELSERLNVSEDTIRRDLREMARGQQLQRVHGGALPRNPAPPYAARIQQATEAKSAIAEAAARLVQDGQLVLMDGGSTTLQLALCLPRQLRATIITNSPPIAVALAAYSRVETILLGGRLNKQEQVTMGASTLDELRSYRADLCFLGVCSLHPEAGIGVSEAEEAKIKTRHDRALGGGRRAGDCGQARNDLALHRRAGEFPDLPSDRPRRGAIGLGSLPGAGGYGDRGKTVNRLLQQDGKL
jgi:DeoR/GlpR family transcriptional regulator of sugar metabolism